MPIPIKLVVCTHVSHDCLLLLADYQKLLAQDSETSLCDQARAHYVSVIQNVDAGGGSSVGLSGTSDDDDDDNVNDSSNTAEQSQEDDLFEVMSNVSDVSKLISEQKADESLSGAFELAHLNKGGYFLKSDLLFRKSSVLGKEIDGRQTYKGTYRLNFHMAVTD